MTATGWYSITRDGDCLRQSLISPQQQVDYITSQGHDYYLNSVPDTDIILIQDVATHKTFFFSKSEGVRGWPSGHYARRLGHPLNLPAYTPQEIPR